LAGGTAGGNTWNSASPAFSVLGPTIAISKRIDVTGRAANSIAVGPPALSSAPTAIDEPSPKTSRPPAIQSSRFGRSYSTTRPTSWGVLHASWIQAPAPWPKVAHSRV
jgi:hypothetical protein